ncbi:MAG: transposase [Acetobacteraceae bacterium]
MRVDGSDRNGQVGPAQRAAPTTYDCRKARIAEQTLQPGASAAVVTQRHGINANLLFGWRRMPKRGLLSEATQANCPPLVLARITTPIPISV